MQTFCFCWVMLELGSKWNLGSVQPFRFIGNQPNILCSAVVSAKAETKFRWRDRIVRTNKDNSFSLIRPPIFYFLPQIQQIVIYSQLKNSVFFGSGVYNLEKSFFFTFILKKRVFKLWGFYSLSCGKLIIFRENKRIFGKMYQKER